MLLELLHCLTERDGGRTPHIPGWSAPDISRLTGLHALQEVVVLLLLAGLLRPVEEVVVGEGDPTVVPVVGFIVHSCLVHQQDPGEDETVGDDVVKLRVVDEDPVAEVGVEEEQEVVGVDVRRKKVRIGEGVTEPGEHRGHVAAPQGGVHHVLLDVEGEGFLLHTPHHLLPTTHLSTEAADELPRRQVARVLPAIAGPVRTEGDGGGRNSGLDR